MNKRSGIESKKRIINAALDVFSMQGYAKANMREIAKIAGISIGGIYLYFKNKEELYKSLINDRRRDLFNNVAATSGKSISATESLSNFLTTYLEYALKHKEFILLHIREHGFSFDIDKKREFFRQQIKPLEKIIIKGIHSGEFRKCNAKDIAKIIMASLRGVILSMALDDDVVITPKILTEFILIGLLKNGGEGKK
ncbi:MAG: TetR/AcrR family transcriptional regulator [Nitrospira sp.]|nr:TetR/AcrR family transcriptional regulator [Nitrospira sp.]